jgi:hypothetical protein
MAEISILGVRCGSPVSLHARISTAPQLGGDTMDVLLLSIGSDLVKVPMIEDEQLAELERSLDACREALARRHQP